MPTFRSVFSTIIFSVDIKRSTSVEGWLSPSGAWKEKEQNDKKLDESLIKANLININNEMCYESDISMTIFSVVSVCTNYKWYEDRISFNEYTYYYFIVIISEWLVLLVLC